MKSLEAKPETSATSLKMERYRTDFLGSALAPQLEPNSFEDPVDRVICDD
jgi:hypothetical protein